MKYDVAIIGGGIAGLTAAYRLSKNGKRVVLIEKEGKIGGMLRSIKKDKYFIEEFYHHIFTNNLNAIALIKELGLGDKLLWKEASTGFYYKNKFYILTVPSDLLRFKPLSVLERIRLGFFLLGMKFIRNPGKLDLISAEEFIVKNSSIAVYNKFFRPLLSAKYGKNLRNISAAWFIDRINIRNKRGYKGEILGYLDGGFEMLVKELTKKIKENKGTIISGEVGRIDCREENAHFLLVGNKKFFADDFIATVPAPVLAKICDFPKSYSEKLSSLENQGAICIVLGLKKKLTNFYWTNLVKENLSFRALIEHTNFQPFSNYGEHIAYLASYPEKNSELWNLKDKELFERYFEDLKKIARIKSEDVNWYEIIKEKNAGLIYNLGILKRILPVKTPIKNIYIAGMLNSHPDRNLEQSIILANKVVEEILNKKILQ